MESKAMIGIGKKDTQEDRTIQEGANTREGIENNREMKQETGQY